MMEFAWPDVFSRRLSTLHDYEIKLLALACRFLGLVLFDRSIGVEQLSAFFCMFLQIQRSNLDHFRTYEYDLCDTKIGIIHTHL